MEKYFIILIYFNINKPWKTVHWKRLEELFSQFDLVYFLIGIIVRIIITYHFNLNILNFFMIYQYFIISNEHKNWVLPKSVR